MAASRLAVLEARMASLEEELQQLKTQVRPSTDTNKDWLDDVWGSFADDPLYDQIVEEGRKHRDSLSWWEKIAGTFADSQAHEEAMELGRKYRESQRPKARKERRS